MPQPKSLPPIHLELSEPHLTRVRVALARHRGELEKLTKAAMDRGVGSQEAYTAIGEIDAVLDQLTEQPSLPFPAVEDERVLALVEAEGIARIFRTDETPEPEFEAENA